MLQRLEVTHRMTSRGDALDARLHDEMPRNAPRQRTLLQAVAMMWRLWRERRAARHALATIDARTLRDIGIAPGLVDYELSRCSWQPLLDWHAVRYVRGADAARADPTHGNTRLSACRRDSRLTQR
jgi:uncharacterized protein YjiS (DUF1127 family)